MRNVLLCRKYPFHLLNKYNLTVLWEVFKVLNNSKFSAFIYMHDCSPQPSRKMTAKLVNHITTGCSKCWMKLYFNWITSIYVWDILILHIWKWCPHIRDDRSCYTAHICYYHPLHMVLRTTCILQQIDPSW